MNTPLHENDAKARGLELFTTWALIAGGSIAVLAGLAWIFAEVTS